jgi:hypothetical protein
LGNHRHPDSVGEAQRCRSIGLAHRCTQTHRIWTDQAARTGHAAAMEMEGAPSCGNPRHHIAPAFDPSPNIQFAAQLAPSTQKSRLTRRSASSRQRIILRLSQAMWRACNAYGPVPLQNLLPYYRPLRPCVPRRYSGPRGFRRLDVSPFASRRQVLTFHTRA